MQTGTAILLTSLLSCGLTAAVLQFLPSRQTGAQADQKQIGEPRPLGESRVQERLEELERKLSAWEKAPQAQPLRQAKGLGRAEVESIVRELLEKGGSSKVEASSKLLPDFDLEKSFSELLEAGQGWEEREAIFKRAKAAGQIDALIAKLKQRAKDNPAIVEAQVELGQAYLEKVEGMPPGPQAGLLAAAADKAFDKALALDPKHWEARFVKALSLSFWPPMFGKKAEAISNFEILLKQQQAGPQKPDYVETYRLLGNLYSEQGKADKARKIWEAGLKRFPKDEDLRKRLRN
ncbi:MAG: hypothetical protein CSA62_01255 [Planctomycetota bacterium]|nr:MAG: hypothetical protein CSA62_01255 [Planctomycetota bacterium]